MHSVIDARKVAKDAGLPVVPCSDSHVSSFEEAVAAAKKIGFPVLFRAALGGSGRETQRVPTEAHARLAFDRASTEAKSRYGNGALLVEKMFPGSRHIQVPVVGDAYGDIVHLYDRDGTLQLSSQSVIDIAPAPWLSDDTKQKLLRDAVKIAKVVGYQNAGKAISLVLCKTKMSTEFSHAFTLTSRMKRTNVMSNDCCDGTLIRVG